MAGHSKWANIKHRKGKQDALRGKIFTKIGKEIQVAVKEGGPNPEANSRLRDVIAKAKANNMPMENIQRAIKRATGELKDVTYEEIIYEGYGPNGVAVIVQALTDNRNRTAGDVRHIFEKFGGNLGATGCVSFLFEKKGLIIVEKEEGIDEDSLMMMALDAGAEDFSSEEDAYEITTSPEDFSKVREALENNGIKLASAEVSMIPSTYVALDGEAAEKFEKLLDRLEENDDVQNVWHNAEFPEGWGE
ncbi:MULTISPECIES: YebC/PmpR family DNA-binding transcriptional regulator [unclassified Caloramator]|uniref:YebC/PmpR family DNA-binding transcriptional regulator n=1 Tax=unclassified Caloramator TaxID=2629145 RepID=UPI00237DD0E2|nr:MULTISPECIES: YebC/PmpR family DNA-binding transcriptional regulator [unclassified Caloramator]MDO6355636.1 YebC/PmpR family DNA-binding transcriptional regulator [Caloramator sp. CAR-1]WDU81965.1 YebC/PmpR family DNA-binding transcriptional regulator [Caloramator sp. Dgby_cultured_2]